MKRLGSGVISILYDCFSQPGVIQESEQWKTTKTYIWRENASGIWEKKGNEIMCARCHPTDNILQRAFMADQSSLNPDTIQSSVLCCFSRLSLCSMWIMSEKVSSNSLHAGAAKRHIALIRTGNTTVGGERKSSASVYYFSHEIGKRFCPISFQGKEIHATFDVVASLKST